MEVTAAQVRALREKTGAGMMDCKTALVSAGGDMDGAVRQLREKGLATAAKRAGKVAAEGIVAARSISPNEAVMLELNCETDFVAKTPQFQELANKLLGVLAGAKVDGVHDGNEIDFPSLKIPGGTTVADAIADGIASMGESVIARRVARFAPEAGKGIVGFYVHAGGKIGVLVEAATTATGEDVERLLRDVAMQVAATSPRFALRDEVSADELAKEREIYRTQAAASGKPEKVLEKIVDGKMEKFYSEFCLVEQEFVRDTSLTVGKLVEQTSQKVGAPIQIARFARMQLGESSSEG